MSQPVRPPRSAARFAALVAGFCALLQTAACGSPPARLQPLTAGDPVPDYAAPTLAGDTVELARLRPRAVMLNVWATWCPPCREEMPDLQTLHERYADRGLEVIGVSIDSRGAEAAIAGFVSDHGLTFTILHDPAETVTRLFRTTGVPQTFLIGPDGRLVERWIGRFDPVAPDVLALVDQALASGSDERGGTGERR